MPGYRGRLAPSPTGYLHIGHARTFWTAFERAKTAGGTLILRMEDLDPDRCRAHYADAALEDLRGLGIQWQEGPEIGGPFAPYEQSRRMSFYFEAWQKLRAGGWIYPCRCSRKDLEAATQAPHEAAAGPVDDEPVYPGTCRPENCRPETRNFSIPLQNSEAPQVVCWRFRVPDGESIDFCDQQAGPQSFLAGQDFGDFVVWRRDGVPGYQLACVVDDDAMRITEVVRGADLLKSTARQILLNRALGYANPLWFHCDLATDARGQRLAKRHDALSLRTLRERGFTPSEILSDGFLMEMYQTGSSS